ncbi:MAG: hypothetical protein HY764_04030 [Candidatus Portnoybacteria bacterium]|nr:hypothetical protein [Candidatus Portnoybacteria bacterium]
MLENRKKSIFAAGVILLILLLVFGSFFYAEGKFNPINLFKKIGKGTASVTSAIKDKFKDSDNDGLRDWEEAKYGTDINNQDSDGDGYLDGEEVASGYNPMQKGSNAQTGFSEKEKILASTNNWTEIFAKGIGGGIKQGKSVLINPDTGEMYSAEELENMPEFQKMLQNISNEELKKVLPPSITDNDIKISQSDRNEDRIAYLTAVLNIIKENSKNIQVSDQDIEWAMTNSDFSKVKIAQKTFHESYEKLKNISTPKFYAEFQKTLLSTMLHSSNVFLVISNAQEDPLKALIAIEEYQKSGSASEKITMEINNLKKNLK